MEGCETRHVAQKEPHFLLKMGQKNKEEHRQGALAEISSAVPERFSPITHLQKQKH